VVGLCPKAEQQQGFFSRYTGLAGVQGLGIRSGPVPRGTCLAGGGGLQGEELVRLGLGEGGFMCWGGRLEAEQVSSLC